MMCTQLKTMQGLVLRLTLHWRLLRSVGCLIRRADGRWSGGEGLAADATGWQSRVDKINTKSSK